MGWGEGENLLPNKCLLPRNKTSNVHFCKDFFHCEGFLQFWWVLHFYIYVIEYSRIRGDVSWSHYKIQWQTLLSPSTIFEKYKGTNCITDRFAWDFLSHTISFALPWSHHFNLFQVCKCQAKWVKKIFSLLEIKTVEKNFNGLLLYTSVI